MRLLSVLVLSLALPLAASAEVKKVSPLAKGANPTTSTIFAKLESLFDTGSMPNFPRTGVLGYAGRCFSPTQENAVKGAAYLVDGDNSGNGPIDYGLNIQSLWNDCLTYFDTMSAGSVSRSGGTWTPATNVGNTLMSQINADTGSFLRMNGNYLIEMVANVDGTNPSYFCYYYLPLAM
jgi:hypothetical protein